MCNDRRLLMRKRLRWIIGACMAALLMSVAAVVLFVLLTEPADPINEDAFAQLRVGMTDQEVEEVFRNMPGYRNDGGQFMRRLSRTLGPEITWRKEWIGPNLSIVMDTDQSGRVTAVSKAPGQPLPSESLNARVNRRFRFGRAPQPIPASVAPPVPQ
jgi:hypothetical protein